MWMIHGDDDVVEKEKEALLLKNEAVLVLPSTSPQSSEQSSKFMFRLPLGVLFLLAAMMAVLRRRWRRKEELLVS
jgi:hypothetical protein